MLFRSGGPGGSLHPPIRLPHPGSTLHSVERHHHAFQWNCSEAQAAAQSSAPPSVQVLRFPCSLQLLAPQVFPRSVPGRWRVQGRGEGHGQPHRHTGCSRAGFDLSRTFIHHHSSPLGHSWSRHCLSPLLFLRPILFSAAAINAGPPARHARTTGPAGTSLGRPHAQCRGRAWAARMAHKPQSGQSPPLAAPLVTSTHHPSATAGLVTVCFRASSSGPFSRLPVRATSRPRWGPWIAPSSSCRFARTSSWLPAASPLPVCVGFHFFGGLGWEPLVYATAILGS
ncbi:hypothetical protein NDU88_003513 [Pleurodeles waltl]|uniref:Uncharacterized protein n=1 Tax=Pleurodeles waltl TaxID=8319 RepID=A0AAV7WSZ4_PLEWA|nr:hypothetical protein NDU88_003513 [Pleurodeles waltl]